MYRKQWGLHVVAVSKILVRFPSLAQMGLWPHQQHFHAEIPIHAHNNCIVMALSCGKKNSKRKHGFAHKALDWGYGEQGLILGAAINTCEKP